MHEITTTMEINAPPRSVWKVLVDFEAHPQWNPFVRSIEGTPREGETLKVFIQPAGAKGMTFRPRVLRVVPDQELRWLGRVVLPGIFDGEHFFKIEPLDQGRRTRFSQGERFTGLLVPVLRKRLDRGTREGFEAMNQALKARVEESSSRT
jgi:hypothetical protein